MRCGATYAELLLFTFQLKFDLDAAPVPFLLYGFRQYVRLQLHQKPTFSLTFFSRLES